MKTQTTHIKTVAPTVAENIAAGYNVGQWWDNTTTGDKYYHKTDGVWVIVSYSVNMACVVRYDTTTATWILINDAAHQPIYFESLTVAETSSGFYNFQVNFPEVDKVELALALLVQGLKVPHHFQVNDCPSRKK